jgi:hypothetical protein
MESHVHPVDRAKLGRTGREPADFLHQVGLGAERGQAQREAGDEAEKIPVLHSHNGGLAGCMDGQRGSEIAICHLDPKLRTRRSGHLAIPHCCESACVACSKN